MAQEDEPDERGRDEVERERVEVEREREAAGFFAAVDLAAVEREAAGFFAADEREAAGFFAAVERAEPEREAVERDAVEREALERERDALARGFAAVAREDDEPLPGSSRAATRRARLSTSPRRPFRSSAMLCDESSSRIRPTALATSLTFFFDAFFAMARV